ncbi:hypothetical protein CYY_009216 [Polysphondylium violaceum]|uniref:Beta-lactamase-related domain-containing protein n=1 Tax=Polysphondylium violaceum TaxID=133409 RepID=A0A8J4PN68_9MYCE|nr:hypothetical protein CYY_009216 [Polysphondylium violaceum]
MKNQLFTILILLLIVNVNLILSCPEYPTPIDIDQNDPLLVKAYAQVDELIQKKMKENRILSFIATIVYQDQIVWSKTYGNVDPLDPKSPPLTLDNNVRIASITKVFTDLMMYQLRDKGVISLDDPISKYYPEFSVRDLYNTKREISFRELASHQSGLPREVPCDFNLLPTDNCTEEVIIENLSKTFLILPQYKQTHYSNLGIALLGRTLAKAAKTNYEKYIFEKILEPLGMLNSSFSYEKVKDHMAIGVDLYPNGTYTHAGILELGWGTPMGGLFSTARDMSKFMSFWMNENPDVLDSSSVQEALSPIALVNDGQTAYGTPFEMYYDSVNSIWMKSKAGALDGYRSQMALVRPLKLGMFFSSLMYISSPDVFTRDAMKIIIPVYEALLLEKNSKPQNMNPEEGDQHKRHHPDQIPDQELVGQYADNEGGVFVVDNSTGYLLANFGDNNNYNVSHFSFDFPHVKRIQLVNTDPYECVFVEDGSNYELVYFNFGEKQSVQVMGQTMYLISKNPNDPLPSTSLNLKPNKRLNI